MNIFFLDSCPVAAAQYHCDRHVVKMILETAQLLSTAHHVLDGEHAYNVERLYKKTHVNHPCAIWVRKTAGNYRWAQQLFRELHKEWKYRWPKNQTKTHASFAKLDKTLEWVPANIGMTNHISTIPLAMPDDFKVEGDPVQSYRNYYREGKQHLHKWTNRDIPSWL